MTRPREENNVSSREMMWMDFLPKTFVGVRTFCEENHCVELMDGSMEGFAWLWFLLRVADDKPEWFPSGKWATLIRMSDRLEAAARASGASA